MVLADVLADHDFGRDGPLYDVVDPSQRVLVEDYNAPGVAGVLTP